MKEEICQGDLLKVERINMPVVVVSKNFFNQSGEIIGCPVCRSGKPGALHIRIETEKVTGYVYCEKMTLLDMNIRRYSKLGSIHTSEIIDITDAIQGIFDYVRTKHS
ncbi:type II toxin-antitoxin system PemK/MazF family toxin [Porcincola intestinalis]|uniref:type II toxin-antitoxin system PemK/MazF family toxin n=1 Tax=Porcincola intestinalis TaxID=2606632 RepID=UPI0023EFB325|nr:type II toxin-antitoxin system PemK/MazF family toxin [Porcincola intestinalis]MCI6766445.1 type II toxin-antitoxin system PemK/MazF family toxin [Lachnospiraceae bacterium]MDD7059563.1 type II toxin-antitoxin system PemK/MazF family toxin [Porcincola intestinalis]MDY5283811.1 type II toxin-antitoxin system PemK/MazF family toxin [Porcincola intestinalis]MDY5579281.1 type II toxin-antitoxin system PemK/MazF family toxin [Porcincola intestinalis]